MLDDLRTKNNAIAHLNTIKELITALTAVEEEESQIDTTIFKTERATILYDGEEQCREDLIEIIDNMPLAIQVRDGWYVPGERNETYNKIPLEFEILLSTGCPACRLIGKFDDLTQPDTVQIQYEDWFTPWIDLEISKEDEEILIQFCNHFYFRE